MKKYLIELFTSKRESVDDYQGVLVPLAQFDVSKNTSQSGKNGVEYTLEDLKSQVLAEIEDCSEASSYAIKSIVINKAMQDIGMGRYNWKLFFLCGFGWFSDNLWMQQVALTLPSLSTEFRISENHVRYTTCYLFVGLCLGATFWGVGSDIMGRRIAFNMTLLITGILGTLAGFASSWVSICGLYFGVGLGVGGNLPVDGALFLEFLPNTSGKLLTLLSIWWPMGQFVASMSGWGYMGGYYPPDKGWRYSLYTIGAITLVMFMARFFLIHLYESPKFLISRGRQAEAVAVVHGIAFNNKTTTWLTEDILNEIGGHPEIIPSETLTALEIIQNKISSFSTKRIGPLFATRELGLNTALLWFCWMTVGLAYPLFNGFLPQYLANGNDSSGQKVSSYEIYRNYAITSVVGIPGSIIACYTVDMRYIGRKGTMAVSTLMSGIMLFLFTSSRSASSQLAFSSILAFFQNSMYGVLYAYTPEVFPTSSRGTGTGISSFLNRISGLIAPIIAANAPINNPNIPIFISGTLFLAAFVAMLFFSIETRGKQMI